ncbi:MAG: hypothetical protein A2289_19830 [Deltaproteobacteria bacterium RIFOXYA12_FULL_58_15]|nr:MAG: hypothetical protein A2289_19830 [Deltaproteobacteria bacterium RIFOXYA12_FULL_58_15]OGR14314.1 MAG: hypothetical protein A2341_18895 [Deltaproteobacteria bacterium RIFOXYB12_FULL_58_9]
MTESSDFSRQFDREYDLHGRVTIATQLSILFYPSFGILDAVIAPEWLGPFLLVRLAVVISNVAVLAVLHFNKTQQVARYCGMAVMILDALGIALMVQLLGGFMSSYYQGFTLIIICMLAVLPWGARETLIVSAVIFLSYIVPSVWAIDRGVLQWRVVVNNTFFLGSIIAVCVIASHLMYNVRCRALRVRTRLEETAKELEQSNQRLVSLDELKTQFFANVNHELRTPLTLLLAPLGAMLHGTGVALSTQMREHLTAMQRNGLKLLKLINDLLDLTKLEEGKTRIRVSPFDLVAFCRNIVEAVRPLAVERRVALRLDCSATEIEVFGDTEQLDKVVLNLLSNALKFTPAGGEVRVVVAKSADGPRVEVRDNGEGIPEGMLKIIFDRFAQVDGSKSRRHDGTGIGLSLVKEIVELHGGQVWADSKLGEGASFIVQFQAGEAHIADEVRERRSRNREVAVDRREGACETEKLRDVVRGIPSLQLAGFERRGREPASSISGTDANTRVHEHTLLVIDDNPDVLQLMRFLLQDEYNIVTESSAESGLALVRNEVADLVISDVMMPGMDGHELCKRIKESEETRQIPVILVTARAGPEGITQGIDSGADDYLPKPFDPPELLARVRSLLRMRKAEADLVRLNRNLKARADDLVDRQRSLFLSTVRCLISALEAKDQYTRNHSVRVTEYAMALARRMNFGERDLRDLELAALLHDVGKIGVPETVLHKPGKLTSEEFALIKMHSAKGAEIVQQISEIGAVAPAVRAHHERYDGTGYPDGLRKVDIPIGARVMAVADTYDAMTSDRPYRQGLSHSAAMKEIVRHSGGQFDPEVVESFLALEDWFRTTRNSENCALPLTSA